MGCRATIKHLLLRFAPVLGVLLAALLATWWAWGSAQDQVHARALARFEQEVSEAKTAIAERMRHYENSLRAAQSLFATTENIDRRQWRPFVSGLAMHEQYPGMYGMSFIAVVKHEELEQYLAAVRADGMPDYTIVPPGRRKCYWLIRYTEPLLKNSKTVGYDISTRAVEPEAMCRARDSDEPALSGQLTLLQANGDTAGAVMYLPVYHNGMPHATVEERRTALQGWVSTPLLMRPLLDNVLRPRSGDIDFEVFDGPAHIPANCLYDSDNALDEFKEYSPDQFNYSAIMQIGGRTWSMNFSSRPAFLAAANSSAPRWILAGGIAISLLLSGLVLSLSMTRARAVALADHMTHSLRENERRIRYIVKHNPGAIAVLDKNLRYILVSDRCVADSKVAAADIIGRCHDEVFPQTPEKWKLVHQRCLNGAVESCEDDSFVKLDGSINYVRWQCRPWRDSTGQIGGIIAYTEDITDRKKVELLEIDRRQVLEMIAQNQPLEETLNRLVQVIQRHAPTATASIMLLRNGALEIFANSLPRDFIDAMQAGALSLISGLCQYANQSGEQVCHTDIANNPLWTELRPIAIAHQLRACWSIPIVSSSGQLLGLIAVYRRQLQRPGQAEVALLDTVWRVANIAIEQRQLTDQLKLRAQTDPLTGVPHRALLEDRLQQAISRAQRYNQMVGLFFIDLDRFKLINDTLGHQSGDNLLQQVCQRLQRTMRQTDTLVRMGGDEFTLILPELKDRQDAVRVAQKLLECLAVPFTMDGHELFVCASIGISVYPQDGVDAITLQKNADVAMYRAKSQGGHTFQCFAPEMNQAASERLELENQLRRAMDHNELELHYQPQLNRQLTLRGLEALVRWNHPKLGMVSPGKFIPAAEESGLIVPLGTWVLREACRQGMAWQRQGLPPVNIAVNVSARQFTQADFLEVVSCALRASGFDPHHLELELTESLLMQNTQDAALKLGKLRQMGVNIAIDDFGTGYSSLAYLQRMPIDTLKIDRSFVCELTSPSLNTADNSQTAVIRAIASMAHSLGMSVVAEGVETVEQRQFLLGIGCDGLQGYLISRPVSAAVMAQLMPTLRNPEPCHRPLSA